MKQLPVVGCVALLMLACGCAPTSNVPAAPLSRDADVYQRVQQASVEVLVDGRLEGSGWFGDPHGYVVTAAHMVQHRRQNHIEVVSPTIGRLDAELVAIDIGHDLALLRVAREPNQLFPFLKIAPAVPGIGEELFVYGTPMFRHGVTLHGRVARSQPSFEYLPGNDEYVRAFNVRGVAPHGSSGGCWVDRLGRVAGNQSGFMVHGNAQTGLVFVVPPDAIRRLIATRTSVPTPTLDMAIEELWEKPVPFIQRFRPGTEGVVPAIVPAKGPAAKAKLHGEMVITAIDGQPVRYRDDLIRYVRTRKPGDTVTLNIVEPNGRPARQVQVEVVARD